MYAYITGEDEHFCFQWFKNRKEADEWLELEKRLYSVCYTNPDCGVLTNKQFEDKFPNEEYKRFLMVRRLGDKLRQRIDELYFE